MTIYAVREISNRIKDSSVVVSAVNPGTCRTDITKEIENQDFLVRLYLRVYFALFSDPPEKGGRKIIHAASIQPADTVHGEYLDGFNVAVPTGKLTKGEKGDSYQKRIWVCTGSFTWLHI